MVTGSSLSELESRLASTGTADLWAPFAAQLRAEWRLYADDPDGELAREALDLIDQALLGYSTPNGLRTTCTDRTKAW